MAYFLRKTKRGNGDVYYQIYDSFYSADKKKSMTRCIKNLGLLSKLREAGETDEECIVRLKRTTAELERARKESYLPLIDDEDININYGSYLTTAMIDCIDVRKHIDLLAWGTRQKFRLSDVLFGLAEARLVDPCSKSRTFEEVFPAMYRNPARNFSSDQLRTGLEEIGDCSQDVIDIINAGIDKAFGRRLDKVYFDCTNYYFEIDAEDDLRRKGPSKENRPNPIVGMALLLDSECIPYQMELYPGNRSEKPYLQSAIRKLREEKGEKARIVQVADKGLNCAENIHSCGENDGYIFSKSPKNMSEKDIGWIFEEKGWVDVNDKGGNLLYRYKSERKVYDYSFVDHDGRTVSFRKAEKRVATFNPSLRKKQCIEITKLYSKTKDRTAKAQIRESVGGAGAKFTKVESVDGRTGEVIRDAEVVVSGNEEKLEHDLKLAGYNLLVTSEIDMDEKEIYGVYHRLWNIERTFRMMKTQLSSRPVFVRKEEAIKGHFLTCYTAILIVRLLEKKFFNDEFSAEEIITYIRNANMTKIADDEYLNALKRKDSKISEYMYKITKLPLLRKRLRKEDVELFYDTKRYLKPQSK